MSQPIAIYPTSASPPTWGHADILRRAAGVFSRVHWVAAINPSKETLFSTQSRLDMMQDYVEYFKLNNVVVDSFEGSIARYAKAQEAGVILRGLRGSQDFATEFELSVGYRGIDDSLEVLALFADPERVGVSSSMVRELARLGEDITAYVSPGVAKIVLNHLHR
ncbi:MAG: pantetheine-phosphate adenylyltransferase [bacterium]|nr:pantetheine-phosphate adenylyltransferase [bacterium]